MRIMNSQQKLMALNLKLHLCIVDQDYSEILRGSSENHVKLPLPTEWSSSRENF